MRAHLELWRGAAGEFLNFGQRLASLDLKVSSMEMMLTEKDGKTRRPLAVPSVLHTQWKLADGRRGTILACISDQPVEFTFQGERLKLAAGEAVFRAAR